jgi:hypothetical protein
MNEMNTLRVPRALDGLDPLTLNMADLRQAEGRLGEVAFTNAARAPELLATFNKAWLDASRYLNLLEYEQDIADRRVAEIRAIVIIDKLPALLAEKGLATSRSPLGSEDIRQAFLDRDPDYKRMQELIVILRSYVSLLATLKKAFENGYNSVKKLLGNDPTSGYRPNPNLPQSPPSSPGLPSDDFKVTSDISSDFFGKPQ